MNNEFIKTFSKGVLNENIGSQELPAGQGRRFEPAAGEKAHRERIHRESKFADDHKNLPFSFSKPKKSSGHKLVSCPKCEKIVHVGRNCVGFVCNDCHEYVNGVEVEL